MRRRHILRRLTRQQANADRCGLAVAEYLALSRRARKRLVRAAREVTGRG